jgi:hypothetical protein
MSPKQKAECTAYALSWCTVRVHIGPAGHSRITLCNNSINSRPSSTQVLDLYLIWEEKMALISKIKILVYMFMLM